jgi:ABC-type glutathione transport system ATPase component
MSTALVSPPISEAAEALGLRSPYGLRRRADRLLDQKHSRERESVQLAKEFEIVNTYLNVAEKVSATLEQLNDQLFQQVLTLLEDKLTIALQEILEQPIKFCAKAGVQRKAAAVDFWIEREGNKEDVLKGQGGSVANILSVGLRMFALTTLDEARHRRFLVLDEQDCWLRPDLVPRLVKIIHDAGQALGFQVLLISHHDVATFEQYADRIYQMIPTPDGVEVRQTPTSAGVPDGTALPVPAVPVAEVVASPVPAAHVTKPKRRRTTLFEEDE